MSDLAKLVQEVVEDLWHRFRSMALVIHQSERFVAAPQGGEPVDERELWLSDLQNRSDEISAIAEDMILRAFRIAADPVHFAILKKLSSEEWLPDSELMQVTRLTRLTLSERVNDLIQVGLVVKDVQTGQVQSTTAGKNLTKLLDEIREALARTIRTKLREKDVTGRQKV